MCVLGIVVTRISDLRKINRIMRYAQNVLMYGAVLCGINCQHIYNLLLQGRNSIYY